MISITLSFLSQLKHHQGDNKKLNFDIKNFKKFEHKIIYIIANFEEEKKFKIIKGVSQLLNNTKETIF